MKLALPKSVQYIIETLTAHGFEAYAVGGCVRDAILGRKPDDWDITTSARPEQIKAVFRRTVDTGIAHGTVTVLHGGSGYEVTTYRIDGEYEDNRHPKEVSFTANLKEDLRRRDFTINAMAYNEEAGLVDEFGGMEDLKRKRICCVGAAEERFGEDALRILRGVRFAAQLGFTLESATKNAMKRLAPTLSNISAERIQVELSKLLLSKCPEQMDDLAEYEIAAVILPEYDGLAPDKRQWIVKQLKKLEAEKNIILQRSNTDEISLQRRKTDEIGKNFTKSEWLSLRWAAVLQFFTEEQTGTILRRLKYDKKTMHNVQGILKFREKPEKADPVLIRKALCAMGELLFSMVLEFRRSQTEREEALEELSHMLEMEQEILSRGECVSLKELAVTGSDLMAVGCPKGKQIGRILNILLEMVLESPEKNEKELLLHEAEKLINNVKQP